MIFTNKYYHWVQLVHVEADNYFILITSIDAKWLSKMIRKIRILNKASHCTLRCYNHCGHRNLPRAVTKTLTDYAYNIDNVENCIRYEQRRKLQTVIAVRYYGVYYGLVILILFFDVKNTRWILKYWCLPFLFWYFMV